MIKWKTELIAVDVATGELIQYPKVQVAKGHYEILKKTSTTKVNGQQGTKTITWVCGRRNQLPIWG